MRGHFLTRVIVPAVTAVAAMTASETANAQAFTLALMNGYSCSDPVYGTNGTYFVAGTTYPSRSDYTPECSSGHTSNSPGSVVTAVETLRAAAAQTVGLISQRIATQRQAALARPMTLSLDPEGNKGQAGVAGGNANQGIGVWVQGAFTRVIDDNSATKFDGNIYTVLAGVDKKLMDDRLLVGLSGGYEQGDFDTSFNQGTVDTTGFLVAPYASFSITDLFSVNATAGYGFITDVENKRKDAATGEEFKGDTDADRIFGSLAGNYDNRIDNILFGAMVGVAYSWEQRDAFTETGTTGTTVQVGEQTTRLGQAKVGLNAGLDLGVALPYVDVQGEYDFAKTDVTTVATNQTKPSDDDFGLRTALGLQLRFSDNLSAMVEGNALWLRDNHKEYGGLARVRVDF